MKQSETISRVMAALENLRDGSSDFDLNPEVTLTEGRVLRPAAVLIALQEIDQRMHVILTQRASHLKHHAGQIAFPGGKRDEGDSNIEQTALREAHEEIGLLPDNVDILGVMPVHETVTRFTVTPVVGMIRDAYSPKLHLGEVVEAFSVPLSYVTDIAQFSIQSRRWRGQRRYYYAVPYGPYYIWGATARILRALAEGMRV